MREEVGVVVVVVVVVVGGVRRLRAVIRVREGGCGSSGCGGC